MSSRLIFIAIRSLGLLLAVIANDASGDTETFVLRAFVPNAMLRQGEVRVVETPGSICLQTLLYTRFPDRVLSAICAKERKNWPEGSACHEDALAYCRVLRSLPQERRGAGRDGAFRWMIEFMADATNACVVISEITLAGPRDGLLPGRTRSLPALPVSEAYVRTNMGLILTDLFGAMREADPVVGRILHRLEKGK
jgi:hypothetical protein